MYGGVDYLFESGEERFMMHTEQAITDGGPELTGTDLQTHFEGNDTDFRSYINQYVLPRPVTVVVAPGIVAQGGGLAHFRFEKASLFLGYDAYYKEAESFERFQNNLDESRYTMSDKVLRKGAEQYKLFGGYSYTTVERNVHLFFHTFRRLELSAALHGAASIGRKNMGNDLVLGITLGARC